MVARGSLKSKQQFRNECGGGRRGRFTCLSMMPDRSKVCLITGLEKSRQRHRPDLQAPRNSGVCVWVGVAAATVFLIVIPGNGHAQV